MGMLAVYQEIKKKDLEKLLESEDIIKDIEDLQEKDNVNLCDIDKMWDALHFLLTGISASYPIENNLLSEFIVGYNSVDECEDFIGFTFPDRVIEISKKINEINFQDYLKSFNMDKFKENKIYPNIWDYTDEKEEIMQELSDSFSSLKKFYNKVAKNKNAILISIY